MNTTLVTPDSLSGKKPSADLWRISIRSDSGPLQDLQHPGRTLRVAQASRQKFKFKFRIRKSAQMLMNFWHSCPAEDRRWAAELCTDLECPARSFDREQQDSCCCRKTEACDDALGCHQMARLAQINGNRRRKNGPDSAHRVVEPQCKRAHPRRIDLSKRHMPVNLNAFRTVFSAIVLCM